ncbi:hypothetical protein KP509_11G084100 [Ceratopteris richardii]|uniref:Uncharacterized protein n=1 Tax=Ceratopteris richardii TaxID=49495 RepID=A0A8T2TXD3_CERRI|nr:hypothetical protein KP509_11G084100 [Ceratopteris richardii]
MPNLHQSKPRIFCVFPSSSDFGKARLIAMVMDALRVIDDFPPNVRRLIVEKLQETWAVEIRLETSPRSGNIKTKHVLYVDAYTQSTWDVKYSDNLLYVQLMTHWDLVDEVVFTTISATSFRFYVGNGLRSRRRTKSCLKRARRQSKGDGEDLSLIRAVSMDQIHAGNIIGLCVCTCLIIVCVLD